MQSTVGWFWDVCRVQDGLGNEEAGEEGQVRMNRTVGPPTLLSSVQRALGPQLSHQFLCVASLSLESSKLVWIRSELPACHSLV